MLYLLKCCICQQLQIPIAIVLRGVTVSDVERSERKSRQAEPHPAHDVSTLLQHEVAVCPGVAVRLPPPVHM